MAKNFVPCNLEPLISAGKKRNKQFLQKIIGVDYRQQSRIASSQYSKDRKNRSESMTARSPERVSDDSRPQSKMLQPVLKKSSLQNDPSIKGSIIIEHETENDLNVDKSINI